MSDRGIAGGHPLPQRVDGRGVVRRVLPEGRRIDADRRRDAGSQMHRGEVDLQHARRPGDPRNRGDLSSRERRVGGKEEVRIDAITKRRDGRNDDRRRPLGDGRTGHVRRRVGRARLHIRARVRRARIQREGGDGRRALVVLDRDPADAADDGQRHRRQRGDDRLPAGPAGPARRRGDGLLRRGPLSGHRTRVWARASGGSRWSQPPARRRPPLPPPPHLATSSPTNANSAIFRPDGCPPEGAVNRRPAPAHRSQRHNHIGEPHNHANPAVGRFGGFSTGTARLCRATGGRLLAPTAHDVPGDEPDDDQPEQHVRHAPERRLDLLVAVSGEIADDGDEGGPADAADDVGDQEARIVHVRHPREAGYERPQRRRPATQDDALGAEPADVGAALLQPVLVEQPVGDLAQDLLRPTRGRRRSRSDRRAPRRGRRRSPRGRSTPIPARRQRRRAAPPPRPGRRHRGRWTLPGREAGRPAAGSATRADGGSSPAGGRPRPRRTPRPAARRRPGRSGVITTRRRVTRRRGLMTRVGGRCDGHPALGAARRRSPRTSWRKRNRLGARRPGLSHTGLTPGVAARRSAQRAPPRR